MCVAKQAHVDINKLAIVAACVVPHSIALSYKDYQNAAYDGLTFIFDKLV